jgi:hypothetical protein
MTLLLILGTLAVHAGLVAATRQAINGHNHHGPIELGTKQFFSDKGQ